MGIVTIGRFFIGDRQAILDIAASRYAIWLGLLFVFSAGFAREYDGEDLLHEPWHLLIPLAASCVTSTVLFILLWLVLQGWRTLPNEWRTYQSFVALYWMTAPLAWLYAIPAERFLPPSAAMDFNLGLLWIVAVWRVLLIIRVVTVIFQASVFRVLFPIMLFADTVLLLLILFVPTPIISLMGGVRSTGISAAIQSLTLFMFSSGLMTWWVWAIVSAAAIIVPRPEKVSSFELLPQLTVERSAWRLAIASLVVWPLILPFTQPQQQRRRKVDDLVEQQRFPEALAYMSQFRRDHFPPYWEVPPRGNQYHHLSDDAVREELKRRHDVAGWVQDAYRRRFAEMHGEFAADSEVSE